MKETLEDVEADFINEDTSLKIVTTCPSDSKLVNVIFGDGALGVTLKRREGVVYVQDIIADSQAVSLDVQLDDELWAVESSIIGLNKLDKAAWITLVEFIKTAPRPLRMTWRRRLDNDGDEEIREDENIDSDSLTIQDIHHDKDAKAVPSTITIESAPSSTIIVNSALEDESSEGHDSSDEDDEDDKDDEDDERSENKADSLVSDDIAKMLKDIHIDDDDIHSEEIAEKAKEELLLSLSKRLYIKEKEKQQTLVSSLISVARKANTNPLDSMTLYPLLQPNRKLAGFGEVRVANIKSNNISSATLDKTIILLSDVIIISIGIPGVVSASGDQTPLVIEEVISLPVCKLKQHLIPQPSSSTFPYVFDVIWPMGSVQLSFFDKSEMDTWLNRIFLTIVSEHGHSNDILGWKHQYLLGSIHSAIVLQDMSLLNEIILACDSGVLKYSVLDVLDDAGYTAMHYACIMRLHSFMRMLYSASAKIDIYDYNGLTCLHWSCLQLDYDGLRILATMNTIMDINIEAKLNSTNSIIQNHMKQMRPTPLFLTLIEGRCKANQYNVESISKCSQVLLDLHANTNLYDNSANKLSLLHYLAANWSKELLELVISHEEFQHTDIFYMDRVDFMTPLHYALTGEALYDTSSSHGLGSLLLNTSNYPMSVNQLSASKANETVSFLLRCGSYPNLRDHQGRTPLAVFSEYCSTSNLSILLGNEVKTIVMTLLKHGARWDDSTFSVILKNKLIAEGHGSEMENVTSQRINHAIVLDASLVHVKSFDAPVFPSEVIHSSPKSASGGCLLCGINFTLFRRQHHCRLCNSVCCDDCSKRKCLLLIPPSTSSTPSRTCDSCYNRISFLIDSRTSKHQEKRQQDKLLAATNANKSTSQVDSNKQELFKSSTNPTTIKKVGSPATVNTDATINHLNETRERLMERGEKLSKLSDKTAQMSDSASEFAKMAKQLRDQHKNSWF